MWWALLLLWKLKVEYFASLPLRQWRILCLGLDIFFLLKSICLECDWHVPFDFSKIKRLTFAMDLPLKNPTKQQPCISLCKNSVPSHIITNWRIASGCVLWNIENLWHALEESIEIERLRMLNTSRIEYTLFFFHLLEDIPVI